MEGVLKTLSDKIEDERRIHKLEIVLDNKDPNDYSDLPNLSQIDIIRRNIYGTETY